MDDRELSKRLTTIETYLQEIHTILVQEINTQTNNAQDETQEQEEDTEQEMEEPPEPPTQTKITPKKKKT